MQNALTLMRALLSECAEMCSTDWSRDLATIEARTRNEGLSFMTITLPKFLDDFMISVEEGKVTSTAFCGWKKRQCLPTFLQGYTSLVFDQKGVLREQSQLQTYAVRSIRQICCLFKKIKQICSQDREQHAIEAYRNLDEAMRDNIRNVSDENLETFIDISRIITSHVFRAFDPRDLVPYHGPGATADRVNGNQKYNHSKINWRKDLSELYQYEQVLYNSEESAYLDPVNVAVLTDKELPARLATVPKTQTKPRVIALEPCAVQMLQQPLKDFMVKSMESNIPTKGHVNFTDQSINQKLALINSKTRKLATVDLSAASDRVHKEFIYLMLSANPELRDHIFATRSRWIKIKDEEIFLNKFASMGSALCFPVEALFFYVLCIQARLKARGHSATFSNICSVCEDIYVYGDDILVPADEVETVYSILHEFGNKVGVEKSFSKGPFRESCGVDAIDGVNVTPIYIRQLSPTQFKGQADRIISWVASANLFYQNGYTKVAMAMKQVVEKFTGNLPGVQATCAGLGWTFGGNGKSRLSKRYQRQEVLTLVPRLIPKKDKISGYPALFKCLLNLNKGYTPLSFDWAWKRNLLLEQAQIDKKHLERSSGFGTLTLQRQWTPPA